MNINFPPKGIVNKIRQHELQHFSATQPLGDNAGNPTAQKRQSVVDARYENQMKARGGAAFHGNQANIKKAAKMMRRSAGGV